MIMSLYLVPLGQRMPYRAFKMADELTEVHDMMTFVRDRLVLGLSWICSDDLMIVDYVWSRGFDIVERSNYFQLFQKRSVLWNRGHSRWMVLLIADNDMTHKRTLTRKEGSGRLQSHSMPHLAICLGIGLISSWMQIWVTRSFLLWRLFPTRRSTKEPELSSNTEVRYWEQNDLLKHSISWKLMGVIYVKIELFQTHRQEMHHISYVEIENPIILGVSLHPQDSLHVVLKLREVRPGILSISAPDTVVSRFIEFRFLLLFLKLLWHDIIGNLPRCLCSWLLSSKPSLPLSLLPQYVGVVLQLAIIYAIRRLVMVHTPLKVCVSSSWNVRWKLISHRSKLIKYVAILSYVYIIKRPHRSPHSLAESRRWLDSLGEKLWLINHFLNPIIGVEMVN